MEKVFLLSNIKEGFDLLDEAITLYENDKIDEDMFKNSIKHTCSGMLNYCGFNFKFSENMDENEMLIIEEIVKYCINDESLYKIGLDTQARISNYNYTDKQLNGIWTTFVNFILRKYRNNYGIYNNVVPNKLPLNIRIGAGIRLRQIFEDVEIKEIDRLLGQLPRPEGRGL